MNEVLLMKLNNFQLQYITCYMIKSFIFKQQHLNSKNKHELFQAHPSNSPKTPENKTRIEPDILHTPPLHPHQRPDDIERGFPQIGRPVAVVGGVLGRGST